MWEGIATREPAEARRSGRRLQTAGVVLLCAAAAAALYVWDPARWAVFPPCPFHWLTGLHCPGCGTLRGLHQLAHGNLAAAFGLNPLMVLCLPLVACWPLWGMVRRAGGRRMSRVFVPAGWIWALLGVIVLFWILRNVPVYPFSLLAP